MLRAANPSVGKLYLLLSVAALAACAEPNTPASSPAEIAPVVRQKATQTGVPEVRHQIVDAAKGGTAGFYFLAPISTKPQPFNAPLDPSLLPRLVIKVCALPACSSDIATFTNTTSQGIEFTKGNGYSLKWDTKKTPLSTNVDYRLRVYVTGDPALALLGFADIDVIASAKDAKAVSADFVALVKDAKLDVKFRVEAGFVSGLAPAAVADSFSLNLNQSLAANVTADNGNGADVLGTPQAVVTSFGGGSAGGSVTDNAAGSFAAIGSGTVQISSDGSISFGSLPAAGVYTINYRLVNPSGSSDATVTIVVGAPDAVDDTISSVTGLIKNLFDDNGSGADNRGSPAAQVVSLSGGTIGGTYTTGQAILIPGGYFVVYPTGVIAVVQCSNVPGTYTINYKIQNAIGSDTATITIVLQ